MELIVIRTVKQVAELTGVSVRTLQYYDEIGILKPTKLNDSGYRLYDDNALEVLQQILFFKELDFPLKEIKEIMGNVNFDKIKMYRHQKELLISKRDRLNKLIHKLEKLEKGEQCMTFEEFDMSEYFNVLEEFKIEHRDKLIEIYGSLNKYNENIKKIKSREEEIAKAAIKQYGSIEKYAKAIKKNLNSNIITLSEQYENFKKDCLEDNNPKLKELYEKLVADLNKDPSSEEVQKVAKEITNIAKQDYKLFKIDNGDNWYYMVQNYFIDPRWIKEINNKYGCNAAKFIGEALKICLGDKQPKINILYENLVSDLSKDPSSNEIQEIVQKIVDETKKSNDFYKVDMGDNYWQYISEFYLSNSNMIEVTDKKYRKGASKFIGRALKYYVNK